jgi:hypothetical protein
MYTKKIKLIWLDYTKVEFDFPSVVTDVFWGFSFPKIIKCAVSLLCIGLSGYSILVLDSKYFITESYFALFKASFLLVSIFILLIYLLKEYIEKIGNNYYEDLEKDLVSNNYSYNDTKELIKKYFLNQPISDWIEKIEDETISELVKHSTIIKNKILEIKASSTPNEVINKLNDEFFSVIKDTNECKAKIVDALTKLTIVLKQSGTSNYDKKILKENISKWENKIRLVDELIKDYEEIKKYISEQNIR